MAPGRRGHPQAKSCGTALLCRGAHKRAAKRVIKRAEWLRGAGRVKGRRRRMVRRTRERRIKRGGTSRHQARVEQPRSPPEADRVCFPPAAANKRRMRQEPVNRQAHTGPPGGWVPASSNMSEAGAAGGRGRRAPIIRSGNGMEGDALREGKRCAKGEQVRAMDRT